MRALTTTFALSLMLALAGPAAAAPLAPQDAAAAVPANVIQVVSGGTWEDGGKKGTYRAIMVAPASPAEGAQIFLQWLAAGKDPGTVEVASVVALQKINDMKLPDAFLSMDFEKSNEVMLYVQPYDPAKESDQSFTVTATLPGKLSIEQGAAPE